MSPGRLPSSAWTSRVRSPAGQDAEAVSSRLELLPADPRTSPLASIHVDRILSASRVSRPNSQETRAHEVLGSKRNPISPSGAASHPVD
ncbi:hypothetical protein E4U43_005942 [Claviceps pusilla]|uniref:Uncharacterized protein n=1 Tax=Claviceps pusilla TaxID=123648 RepID=A0A9P7N2C5_9HYPO|nr:hypothetical protein E4U43_005942 [Claviceps pusilla]